MTTKEINAKHYTEMKNRTNRKSIDVPSFWLQDIVFQPKMDDTSVQPY